MIRRRKHQDGQGRPRRSWSAVLAALAFFGLLASTSIILTTLLFFGISGLIFRNGPLNNAGLRLVLGLLISIAGQLGDLTVSAIKRDAGVDETGTWIPGRGGVLDRANSLLLSLSSSFQVNPSFWVNPASGIEYNVVVQVPQYRIDGNQDQPTHHHVQSNGQAFVVLGEQFHRDAHGGQPPHDA